MDPLAELSDRDDDSAEGSASEDETEAAAKSGEAAAGGEGPASKRQKQQAIDFETLRAHGYKEGPSVLVSDCWQGWKTELAERKLLGSRQHGGLFCGPALSCLPGKVAQTSSNLFPSAVRARQERRRRKELGVVGGHEWQGRRGGRLAGWLQGPSTRTLKEHPAGPVHSTAASSPRGTVVLLAASNTPRAAVPSARVDAHGPAAASLGWLCLQGLWGGAQGAGGGGGELWRAGGQSAGCDQQG